MKKLRLIKVLVQPHFVLDDGEVIEEIEHPVITIPASEWPTYSSDRFSDEVENWEKELNSPPNRAERRRTKKKKAKATDD